MSAKRDLQIRLELWLRSSRKRSGNTMNTIHSSKYPIGRWTLWGQDILMVSAFLVWAVILGLMPVLVLGALIAV
jgi:hypothetical protein